MIENLAYELSVLAKAVQHKNLSAASAHVGLSQPQLSRLVSRIEGEFKVLLLDRSARRKSGLTTIASDLAMAFTKGMGRVEAELLAMSQDRETTHLRVGTLAARDTGGYRCAAGRNRNAPAGHATRSQHIEERSALRSDSRAGAEKSDRRRP